MLELCCLLCFQICRLHSADFGLNIRAQMLLAAFPQCRGGVNAILLWTVKVSVLLFIYMHGCHVLGFSQPSHRGAPITAVLSDLGGQTKTPARTRSSNDCTYGTAGHTWQSSALNIGSSRSQSELYIHDDLPYHTLRALTGSMTSARGTASFSPKVHPPESALNSRA